MSKYRTIRLTVQQISPYWFNCLAAHAIHSSSTCCIEFSNVIFISHRFVSRVLNASDVVSDELLDEDEAAAEEQERPRDGVLWVEARCTLAHWVPDIGWDH